MLAVYAGTGCVESFRGSNLQIDLSPSTPAQAAFDQQPNATQLPSNVHWKLYGITHDGDVASMFELQRFEVHTIVDLGSPCFIDVGDNVPHPGLHVTQFAARIAEDTGIPDYRMPPEGTTEQQRIDAATAAQRVMNVGALASAAGIKVVTSASETIYPRADADCSGTGIPAPSCTDDESNARRLALCQELWSDSSLFEGTDRILTAPLNGTTHGFVVGLNPINLAPVGGAQFFVDEAVEEIDEYALYVQTDGADGPGTFLVSGIPQRDTRGVERVHLESPFAGFTAELAIFSDLDEDRVHF